METVPRCSHPGRKPFRSHSFRGRMPNPFPQQTADQRECPSVTGSATRLSQASGLFLQQCRKLSHLEKVATNRQAEIRPAEVPNRPSTRQTVPACCCAAHATRSAPRRRLLSSRCAQISSNGGQHHGRRRGPPRFRSTQSHANFPRCHFVTNTRRRSNKISSMSGLRPARRQMGLAKSANRGSHQPACSGTRHPRLNRPAGGRFQHSLCLGQLRAERP
mmetsp:Transcript_105549/g.264298  ORF Transcript_105549/g.264298 Transcript_105549/m.264298 type:complete len:218 (-) Transcript_105549:331-984(-)